MARESYATGTISGPTGLTSYLSGLAIAETAAAVAIVKVRDALPSLGVTSMVETTAGLSTAGVHYVVSTALTAIGESIIGAYPAAAGVTFAGTKIISVTVPTVTTATRDVVVGRNVYLTKAGAPATAIIPTNAQWFLPLANPSTTLTAANNNLPLVASGGSVGVVLTSAAGFNAGPAYCTVATNLGPMPMLYQSIVSATLTTCTFPTYVPAQALMATGGAVTQAALPDNTSTTLAVNLADASFTATNPPLIDRSGPLMTAPAQFAAVTGGSNHTAVFDDSVGVRNGQVYVDVTSGTVSWVARGA